MFKRVLVPLDGSATAETILPFIERIAGPLDMEIDLLRVVTLDADETPGARHAGPAGPYQRLQREAEDYLQSIVDKLEPKGIRASAHVRIGLPTREIVAAARDLKADLIAMTTHGRTGLRRLLFGSVATEVLRDAPTPLFLYKA
ncbi:MAG: universal stress protein [Candidatus Methylomirabilia bacterium]